MKSLGRVVDYWGLFLDLLLQNIAMDSSHV